MSFLETIARAKSHLQEQGRVSLRALRIEFELNDETLAGLVDELVDVQRVAALEGKILSWIGGVSAEAPTTAAPAVADETAASPLVADAERRQLTVMFCDLVNSTELSQRLGPEGLREAVRAYQESCGEVIHRFEGHIAQYLGDGLLVYFGYPQAHEDDPVRAVNAALGLLDGLQRLNDGLGERLALLRERPLQIRVAVHTGPVVVGALGDGERRQELALGDTVNIAARLQEVAQPDSVVISAATRRLVRGVFVTESLGPATLKGIADPIPVHRVLRATGVQSRLELQARTGPGLTPLVGREQELNLLVDRWDQAREGHGQALLLSGEAGMGKSRLVQALRDQLADQPYTWLEGRCSAYHEDSAFYPVIEFLEQGLLFDSDDSPEVKIGKLERALQPAGLPLSEAIPLFAALLSVPLPQRRAGQPARYAALSLTPEAFRRKTLEAMVAWLFGTAEQQPVILLLEDLHWVDPSTLELLGMLVKQVPTVPVLLLFTFRPGFESPWAARSHLMQLALHPLTRKQVEAMVEGVAKGKPLPALVREQLVAKTDGVPLFVEELTKSVLESDLLAESDQRYERSDPLPELGIPSTLQDSLMARLDRLGPAKEVAQLGSVLGREFSHELLAAVSGMDSASLERAIDELARAELLYRRGVPPRATYTFKHALIQDTAYQSLLEKHREAHHARVVDVLEKQFPEQGESRPEVLARHCEHAGRIDEAIAYYQRAGKHATERSANAEAISQLQRALDLLGTLPKADARELEIQMALGIPLIAAKGWGSAEAERVYERAVALGERIGEGPELANALGGALWFHITRCQFEIASSRADRLMELATQLGDESQLAAGHWSAGITYYFRGRISESLEHLDHALTLADAAEGNPFVASEGTLIGLGGRIWSSWALWVSGHPDRALRHSCEAIEMARESGSPFHRAFALSWGATVHYMRRDPEPAQEIAREAIAIAEEQGFPIQTLVAKFVRGWAVSASDLDDREIENLLAEFQQALAQLATTGTRAAAPQILGILAEIERNFGRHAEAFGSIDGGLAIAQTTGQPYWDADLLRVKAELLLHQDLGADGEAERLYREALVVAHGQQAKSLELRAATSLGRLLRDQGKKDEARALLAPVYDWFTEGFDTQDLRDAKALLDELV